MGCQVCTGGTAMCSFGAAPATLVFATHPINSTAPASNISDMVAVANVTTFGACSSPANPLVAAATAAALGVLTPQPCIPVPAAPWSPGSSTVMLAGMPALDSDSTLMCSYGGSITIINSGQFTVTDG